DGEAGGGPEGAERFRAGVGRVRLARGECDRGALGGELLGDGSAQAAARAADERDPPLEPEVQRRRYASEPSSQSARGGQKMSTSSVFSIASALCGRCDGMWSTSPAATSTTSDSSSPSQKRSFPSRMYVSCSFSCSWRGTMAPCSR